MTYGCPELPWLSGIDLWLSPIDLWLSRNNLQFSKLTNCSEIIYGYRELTYECSDSCLHGRYVARGFVVLTYVSPPC